MKGPLRKRLEDLEAGRSPESQGSLEQQAVLSLYFKTLENHQRQERGEEPLPLTPEEQAVDVDDRLIRELEEHWREMAENTEKGTS